jgi:hypothetical protein
MNYIMQMLMQQLSGNAINKIAQQLGLDANTASKAVGVALPLLMSALARNTSTTSGAASLANALAKDHDGSILDDIMGYLGGSQTSAGASILKHILGTDQAAVTSRLGQTAGVDSDTMSKVMEMVAPLLMGALGKTTQEQGLDSGSLADFLNTQQEEAKTQQPNIIGSLNSMLDSDGDGNAMDDIGGILGKLFS